MALIPDSADMDKADERIAQLYRDVAREEPPAHLDKAILAAARERTTVTRPREPRWRVWQLPFALAAVAVVTVSLVGHMRDEGAERIGEVPEATVPARTAEAPLQQPSEHAELRAETAAPKAAESRQQATTGQVKKRIEVPAGGATSSRDAATTEQEVAAPPLAQSAPVASSAPAAPAAPREETRGRAAVMRSAPTAPPAAADSVPLVAELEREPPAVWIERMLRLRREGRVSEADALLAEFRKRFPTEALPAELR